jgi:hypothetical protein
MVVITLLLLLFNYFILVGYLYQFHLQYDSISCFKLSLCSVLTVSTFGCFPSVWFILTDVSDPSVRSILKGLKPLKMDLTEGSETSANIKQTLGKHPKVDTVNVLFFIIVKKLPCRFQ